MCLDFQITVCLTLYSKKLPVSSTFSAKITLKSDSRSEFITNLGQKRNKIIRTERLQQDQEKCFTSVDVSIKEGYYPNSDEPPLEFKINVEENPIDNAPKSQGFCPTCGFLDPRKSHQSVMYVPFKSGCEGDVCEADLSLTVSSDSYPSFVIGSSDFITLMFVVANLKGDPILRPQLKVPIPDRVTVRQVPKGCKVHTVRM